MTQAPLLSKRNVAHLLGMHPTSVMRLVRQNKLPKPFRPGGGRGAVRWRPQDIEAWLASRAA